MISLLWRVIRGAVLLLLLLVVVLLIPVAHNEIACRGESIPDDYAAILPPEHHRPESRTYLTYPEWHIVHAYDDYAQVIATGDPHDFGFLQGIHGFWAALCDLSKISGQHGGFPWETKQMVYVIGISFTVELVLRAAYEETVGRAVVWFRGPARAPLDDLFAQQARGYATFLQQVPWYQWDFLADAAALENSVATGLRDRERQIALGLEYKAKAVYAQAIAAAVENVGADALTLRMIVTGYSGPAPDGVSVVAQRDEGTELETPRYRALTELMLRMAQEGVDFVEIAGNDDIMLTVLADAAEFEDARSSMRRQGYGDHRHLVGLKVRDLGDRLRGFLAAGVTVEHIHDY
ncbi:hypothetical protein [Roseobacter sp. MH60115]|uniref:hypothetical protein n=1 Tax=Roseobacter sp. MH60115 TaxID=2785324 RepID=UPI002DDC82A3|nr:hypothetical protein [Roseobacter sp. MH60115]